MSVILCPLKAILTANWGQKWHPQGSASTQTSFHQSLVNQGCRNTHIYGVLPLASKGGSCLRAATDAHAHKQSTRLYDKRDDFNFSIVNFPYLCSNIPSSPAYGVFVSQLIRYCRASSKYHDFVSRSTQLVTKLKNQGYVLTRLKLPLRNSMDVITIWWINITWLCHRWRMI